MYKLICMAFDGGYVTEYPNFLLPKEDGFKTVHDAWEHSENICSRWFFYPFHFVITSSGITVRDAGTMEYLNGKRVETVVNFFKKVSALPEASGLDAEDFYSLLYSVWHEEHE
jgi:hypothetical protein